MFGSYQLDQIDFKSGDLVIDIGANSGELFLYFLLTEIDIEYSAVEAGILEFDCLTKNIGGKSELHNVAVSNSEGTTTLYVHNGLASSPIIETPFYTNKDIVTVKRLDSLNFGPVIKLIKIHAEGAEPEVLQGASETLKKTKYVSIDVGKERGIEEVGTSTECVSIMKEFGFDVLSRNSSHRETILFWKV